MTTRRLVRLALRLGAAALAIALTVVLAKNPAAGTFTGTTATGGSSVTANAQFCTSPGVVPVTVTNDAWVDQAAPATLNGTTPTLQVRSANGSNRRTYLRFTMPSRPAGCVLEQAELRLYNSAPTGGRTIDVYRADPGAPLWEAGSLTWNNQPGRAGTAVGVTTPAGAGWQSWIVTDHARTLLTGTNNGFVLRDRTEGQNGPFSQEYAEQSSGGILPVLRMTWG